MKKVRLVEGDWGGKAHEVQGVLELYGYRFEAVTVKSGAHLNRLCEEAIAEPAMPTLVLFSEGIVNQFNKKIRDKVPAEAGGLRVLWIGVPAPRGYRAAKERRVAEDGPIDDAALIALGETTERKQKVLAAVNKISGPRFCDAILTAGVFYLYLNERDLELHLSIKDVAEHYDRGDLVKWLGAIVRKASKKSLTAEGAESAESD